MKRRFIIGLAAVGILGPATVIASSALALESTAWTCVSGGTGGQRGNRFKEADCATQDDKSGTFGHVEIPLGQKTQLTPMLVTKLVLKTVIAGAALTLEATGIECLGRTVENSELPAIGMRVSGAGELKQRRDRDQLADEMPG